MSLRSRLLLAVALVAVVALVAADFATYSFLRSFLDSRTDQSLQQAVGALLPPRQPGAAPAGLPGTTGTARATGTGAGTSTRAATGTGSAAATGSGASGSRTTSGTTSGTGTGTGAVAGTGTTTTLGTGSGTTTTTGPAGAGGTPGGGHRTVPTGPPPRKLHPAPGGAPTGNGGPPGGSAPPGQAVGAAGVETDVVTATAASAPARPVAAHGTSTLAGPGSGVGPGTGAGLGGATQINPVTSLPDNPAQRFPGFFIETRTPSGTVLGGPYPAYQASGKSYVPVLPATITGFAPATADAPPETFFFAPSVESGGPEFRVLAAKLHNGDILVVATSTAGNSATLQRLLVIALAVTGGAILAALVLGWWLVRLGLRPLDEVEVTAVRIADGQLSQRVPGENERTEIGRLARTLNIMLARIERAFAERDLTEAELRVSEERLRRFVGDASHELRTPLAAVSAYAELFDRGASDRPEDLARVMAGIQGESSRMKRLVEDLLLLARLDEGRPLERAPVDLVAVAAAAVDAANAVGPAWPVTLEAEQPIEIVGDEARIRQVIDNLLGNVRAHTSEGTPATVRVAHAPPGETGVVIEVADRGPGVSAHDAAHIFERFYRADPSRARSHGGAGLGLSIVSSVVAAHGGRVGAAARFGGGTVITVRLPWYPPVPPMVEGNGVRHPDAVKDEEPRR